MDASLQDKAQIGLTSVGEEALAAIMELKLFATEGDAYKFAATYALGCELPIESAPQGGYHTKFNAQGGLDRDGVLRDVVSTLSPESAARPYWTSERLAELGLCELAQRLAAHESLAEILSGAGPSGTTGTSFKLDEDT